MTTTIERTAIHEAAHAVMAVVLRGRCEEVSIVRTHETLGHADVKTAPDLPSLLVGAAGAAAERIAFGKAAPLSIEGDRELAGLHTGGVDYVEYLAVAEWMLSIHWQAVLDLAGVLSVRKTMNHHDVRRAVGNHLHPKQKNRPAASTLKAIAKARL